MKTEKLVSAVIAIILATGIALAGIGCISTGFGIEIEDWSSIITLCLLCAAVCAACHQLRWGVVIYSCILALGVCIALRYTDLLLSVEKLAFTVTQYYDRAYGWGYLRWSDQLLTEIGTDQALALLGCVVLSPVVWCVVRRKWFGFGVIVGLAPLVMCCIVTDTAPSGGWLWALLTLMALLVMTQYMRRINPAQANALTAWVLIPVILFTSCVFRSSTKENYRTQSTAVQLALVRIGEQLSRFFPSFAVDIGIDAGIVGQSSWEALAGIGPRKLGTQTVMWLESDFGGTVYLRGQSFDVYTGSSWEKDISTVSEGGWPQYELVKRGTLNIKTAYTATFRFFPYYLYGSFWAESLKNGCLTNDAALTSYSFTCYNVNTQHAVMFSALSQEEAAAYLALPEGTLESARAILDRILVEDSYSTQEKAALIESYVKRSASYSLDTQKMPSGEEDFVIWFLEDSETGYCVHFASAATVLLRAAGIPARYVTGYSTSVSRGTTTEVRGTDAHAWVEYLDPSRGWTVMDPTPSAGGSSIGDSTLPTEPPVITEPPIDPTQPPITTEPPQTSSPTQPSTNPIINLPTGPTEPPETTQPNESTGTEPSENNSDPPELPATESSSGTNATEDPTVPSSTDSPAAEPVPPVNLVWLERMLWVLLVWAALLGQRRLRIRIRHSWHRWGHPNTQALRRWRHARLVSKLSGHPAEELQKLAEKAAYSQHTITDEELQQFSTWHLDAKQALKKKNWLLRGIYTLVFALD